MIDLQTGETDLFVLQIQVADVNSGSFLAWPDSGTNTWVNAVDGNFGGKSSFQGDGAYNPGGLRAGQKGGCGSWFPADYPLTKSQP